MTKGRVWVVAGAPGAGKSTFANLFLQSHPAALLDKDTLFNPLIDSFLSSSGRSLGERESEWFDSVIKPSTYKALAGAAHEISSYGCDVVVTAPYTEALYEAGEWESLCDLIEAPSQLVWIKTDVETLRQRLMKRGFERDGDKLQDIEAYARRVHLNEKPVAPHVEIDNRLCAESALDMQASQLVGASAFLG